MDHPSKVQPSDHDDGHDESDDRRDPAAAKHRDSQDESDPPSNAAAPSKATVAASKAGESKPSHPESPIETANPIRSVQPVDVLLGRGGEVQNLPGNRYYRKIVNQQARAYSSMASHKKPLVAMEIVSQIQQRGGRFLRRIEQPKRLPSMGAYARRRPKEPIYEEIGHKEALSKTSQALRSAMHRMRQQDRLQEDDEGSTSSEAAKGDDDKNEDERKPAALPVPPSQRPTTETPTTLQERQEDAPEVVFLLERARHFRQLADQDERMAMVLRQNHYQNLQQQRIIPSSLSQTDRLLGLFASRMPSSTLSRAQTYPNLSAMRMPPTAGELSHMDRLLNQQPFMSENMLHRLLQESNASRQRQSILMNHLFAAERGVGSMLDPSMAAGLGLPGGVQQRPTLQEENARIMRILAAQEEERQRTLLRLLQTQAQNIPNRREDQQGGASEEEPSSHPP